MGAWGIKSKEIKELPEIANGGKRGETNTDNGASAHTPFGWLLVFK